MTRNQTKAMGWKRVCGSEKQEGEQREIAGRHVLSQSTDREEQGLSGGLPQPVPRALNSRVLHQLLRVLDFKALTDNRAEALAHLHEEPQSCCQAGSQSKSMQDTALHSRCRNTWSAGPVLPMLPSTPFSYSFTHTGIWESQGSPESHICDSITGRTKGSTLSLLSIVLRPLNTGIGQ